MNAASPGEGGWDTKAKAIPNPPRMNARLNEALFWCLLIWPSAGWGKSGAGRNRQAKLERARPRLYRRRNLQYNYHSLIWKLSPRSTQCIFLQISDLMCSIRKGKHFTQLNYSENFVMIIQVFSIIQISKCKVFPFSDFLESSLRKKYQFCPKTTSTFLSRCMFYNTISVLSLEHQW